MDTTAEDLTALHTQLPGHYTADQALGGLRA